ncbi:MAG: tetratricopeptide repeat protein [Alkalispirochaeta sp.]|jgi:TolA-binding protein
MNKSTGFRVVCIAVFLALTFTGAVSAQSDSKAGEPVGEKFLADGITAFTNSDFDSAMAAFRKVLLEDGKTNSRAEGAAYFWLAKSAMAIGRLGEAERNLEYYLRTFPDHEYSVEARYQRGRVLYLQEDYEAAIEVFAEFVQNHGGSPFVANATYWSAESMFQLGRLQEAKQMFEIVLRDHPTSFRVEAARYRITLIDLNTREQELLELLKWSHQEYLLAQDEFDRRERVYQEAIASYQHRLLSAAGEDFREEIVQLTSQVHTLQELLRNRETQIDRLEEQLTSLRNSLDSFDNPGSPRGGTR